MTVAVSVLMPVFDGETWLEEAMRSVLTQTRADLELVVVDDASRDGSVAIAERLALADARVHVVRGPHRGLVGALNRGLAECRAPIVARLDADDVALPDRLERQLAYLEAHPGCVGIGGQVDIIDEEGDPFGWILNPLEHEAIVADLRRSRGAIQHTTAAFRASEARAVGGYRPGFLAEDVDLFLRLAERGRLANLPHHLCRYRKREDSLTARWSAEAVRAESERRARDFDVRNGFVWTPEPRGEALQIARMGLAVHSGFDQTARKYYRRLVGAEPFRPWLRLRIASRLARSWARRLLQPPVVPEP